MDFRKEAEKLECDIDSYPESYSKRVKLIESAFTRIWNEAIEEVAKNVAKPQKICETILEQQGLCWGDLRDAIGELKAIRMLKKDSK